jgi:hypothetical protein
LKRSAKWRPNYFSASLVAEVVIVFVRSKLLKRGQTLATFAPNQSLTQSSPSVKDMYCIKNVLMWFKSVLNWNTPDTRYRTYITICTNQTSYSDLRENRHSLWLKIHRETHIIYTPASITDMIFCLNARNCTVYERVVAWVGSCRTPAYTCANT